jgi:adenylate cyclase
VDRSPLVAAVVSGAAIVIVVLVMRSLGLLQGMELAAYDRYLRSLPQPPAPDSRILVLAITEEDIQELGHWPISDEILARTLERLIAAGAQVIGLDVYRDLPVPPGAERLAKLLQREPRIIAAEQIGDEHSEGIRGPAVLRGSDRVGLNEILVDPDAMVRRGLLFANDEQGAVGYSFALRIALLYLRSQGIYPRPDPERPELLRLGPTTLRPFRADDGGYVAADDAGYQILIDYHGAIHTLEAITLGPLLRGQIDPERIRDRIVLIGVVARSLPDFFRVPVWQSPETQAGPPGVMLHGYIVTQLLRSAVGDARSTRVLAEWQEILCIVLVGGLGCALGGGFRRLYPFVLTMFLGLAVLWLIGAAAIRVGLWIPPVAPGMAWVGAMGLVMAWSSIRNRAQHTLLMRLFSIHVSNEMADQIWAQRDEFFKGGHPRTHRLMATALFLDIKGYSVLSDRMEPESLMEWLNGFMQPMTDEVLAFGGVVDDYFGDGLKASFGVPFPRETEEEIAADARQAVRCALAMESALSQLNQDYSERGLPGVAMRVGIHTGPVVLGSLGSAARQRYTAIGSAVVTAQRLESLGEVAHDFEARPCRILISGETETLLDETFKCEGLGSFPLKGREEQIPVYRVLGCSSLPGSEGESQDG